ncbi:cell division protein FtsZ [Mycoplasmopsis gallinacea]|uniref:Cell division protein FtsZ n=1 Tax=Mycoplasmopsis gallinacea TaxID=29556 RepID=A0A449A432_9BACT|nr:cell division protein FtsZ [Mycoplasmopsis gallinacea]VEU59005.1 cell division protein [Mycoplasmopsis gallinacea]
MNFENRSFDRQSNNMNNKMKNFNKVDANKLSLKVIGVGGGGNNAVGMTINENFPNVEFLVANTDFGALHKVNCNNKIHLGKDKRGLGAGSNPEVGRNAALESLEDITTKLDKADVIIIAASLGGGTGTGASPVIADAARKLGALTIAVVTTPFIYEGTRKMRVAKAGLNELKEKVDAYIVVSNEKLIEKFSSVPAEDLFKMANVSLKNIILAINDALYNTGTINIDFADVKRILSNGGLTAVGIGKGNGTDRAKKAVDKAFEQCLYENDITNANRVLINITHDSKTTQAEIRDAVNRVYEKFGTDPKAENNPFECIVGQQKVETQDKTELFKVSIIATATSSENVAKDPYSLSVSSQNNYQSPSPIYIDVNEQPDTGEFILEEESVDVEGKLEQSLKHLDQFTDGDDDDDFTEEFSEEEQGFVGYSSQDEDVISFPEEENLVQGPEIESDLSETKEINGILNVDDDSQDKWDKPEKFDEENDDEDWFNNNY